MLTSPDMAETSTMSPSPIVATSGSGCPPRASTSVKRYTGDARVCPATVKETVRPGNATSLASRPEYGVAVSV